MKKVRKTFLVATLSLAFLLAIGVLLGAREVLATSGEDYVMLVEGLTMKDLFTKLSWLFAVLSLSCICVVIWLGLWMEWPKLGTKPSKTLVNKSF